MSAPHEKMSSPGETLSARRKWGAGPTALTWAGAVILTIAVVCGGFGVWSFSGVLPTGVISSDGDPGGNALGAGEIPGTTEINLEAGESVVVWEVAEPTEDFAVVLEDIRVMSELGEIDVRRPSVSENVTLSGAKARAVGQFEAPDDGTYTVGVSTSQDYEGSFVLTPGDSMLSFFIGVFSTVLLWLIAIGGGIIGVPLLFAGILWGVVRSRRTAS